MTEEEANMALGCNFKFSLTTSTINNITLDHHNLNSILISLSSVLK